MFDKIKRGKQVEPQDEKGQSLVEMAFVAPLLLLMFIGVLEVGWAIRGYIVLVNADREATRFAARGQYLDFGQTDLDAVGYGNVLSHTLTSISQQLPFDVVSDDPNGTLIVSHYLVDTGQPCADPPCNDDCAADHNNQHGGCDCSAPDRREPDYPYDDLILHPGMSGYEHFTALYGIPRQSRINHDELVAQLKEQNDALNCALYLKDPAVPMSTNSVVVVETFYDQPQLLGVPLISNHFTDPVPLYAHTMMRISSDARGDAAVSQGSGCELLPIAVHTDTVRLLDVGDLTGNIRNGTGSGDFGWLRWTDDTEAVPADPNSEQYLALEIGNTRLAINDYREPEYKDPNDTSLNPDDWVWAMTGNVNSNGVARTELDARVGQTLRFPVWDVAEGQGSNVVYHVVDFAMIRLDGFDLTGNPKEVWGTFMGWDAVCGTGGGDGGDPPGGDDDDSDGISNSVEDFNGDGNPDNDDADGDGMPNYQDTDSDGDTIPDSTEGSGDADGDGTPNFLDTDADDDGVSDSVEGAGDSDGDGTPDFLDNDSDNDGISDGVEGTGDADGDGMPNYLDTEADGDGISDSTEGAGDADGDGTPNFLDTDSDGDTIPDSTEGSGDADGDGTANFLDTDSDGDTIPDSTEGTGDADGDGTPNYLDTDADGDTIPDSTEGTGDADGDGTPNYLDTDADGDGIGDSTEGAGDADGDGTANYLDTDADGDGIPDSTEGTGDADGDGTANFLDTDSDGDSIPDSTEGTGDADGDGTPNYLDTDSDGDGTLDSVEGTGDVDGDGTPNYLDPDTPGGPTTIATDGFESGNWSGGSGWSNNWNTKKDVSISTSGEHSGSYHVRLRGNKGRITRRVDVSGVSNARLQFWWKAKSFEGSEYARVRVYDGSWHTVFTVNNGQDDNVYHFADVDISGYNMVSDFRVRFESKMNSSNDYFYVDDIEVIGN